MPFEATSRDKLRDHIRAILSRVRIRERKDHSPDLAESKRPQDQSQDDTPKDLAATGDESTVVEIPKTDRQAAANDSISAVTVRKVQAALDSAGVEFANGEAPGVRLRKGD